MAAAARLGEVHGPPAGRLVLPLYRHLGMANPQPAIAIPSQTFHACDSCRKAKAKCSGEQDCVRCLGLAKLCVYGDGKRDREKKERDRETRHHGSTRRRNDDLEDALRQLSISPNLDAGEKKGIQVVLNGSPAALDEGEEDTSRKRTSEWRTKEHLRTQWDSEASASSEVPSTESLDTSSYDVARDQPSSTSGFLGKASEITWMQHAQKQARTSFMRPMNVDHSFEDNMMAEASGPMINRETEGVEESQVNPFAWPPPPVALAFLTSYFDTIHPAFPVLFKADFMAVYDQLDGHDIRGLSLTHGCWLSQANLIFAIGARFACLGRADHVADEVHHQTFYARAKSLALDYEENNAHPDLHQLTYGSLLCLYLLTDNQINSAWDVIGSTIRHAIALGLHLRNTAGSVIDRDREFRVRLWWSLYSLECLLGECTGRPSCISDDDISVPLPIDRDEADIQRGFLAKKTRHSLTNVDLPPTLPPATPHSRRGSVADLILSSGDVRYPFTSSTYFIRRTQLSLITHQVLARLYCASSAKLPWSEIQDLIRDFDLELIAWVQNLPPEVNILNHAEGSKHELERTSLGMQYHSTRMILHRSCLCHSVGHLNPDSQLSEGFSRTALLICLGSARELIRYLPDAPNPAETYTKMPWWSLLHYLCQVASVLILEIVVRAEHAPNTAHKILEDAKKVVSWLRAISVDSPPAHNRWLILDALLREVAPRIGGDTDDMPGGVPIPSHWSIDLSEQPSWMYQDEIGTENSVSASFVPLNLPENAPFAAWACQGGLEDWGLVSAVEPDAGFPTQDDTDLPSLYSWL